MSHTPRKRFGQHFLCDQSVVQSIVDALSPRMGEHLIEIGPGQGAITLPILKIVKQLDVVELDRDLIPELEERTQHAGRLTIHAADALKFDFASLKTDSRPLRIFGNLPYNISTPLIFHLLTYAHDVSDMVFMLQKEVAERLAAEPSSEHYGRLSVMAQYHCEPQLLFDVPPTAFFPPPKVESTIIRLVPYKDLPCKANSAAVLAKVVQQAFNQRRKTLRNSLKSLIETETWEKLAISSTERPENLSIAQFVEISNTIKE